MTEAEGPPTTTQVLERIKEAESEVEDLLQRAREAREAALTKARQDAARHLRGAEERAREAHQETVATAAREAKAEADRLKRAAQTEVAKLQDAFEGRIEAAKGRILTMFERALDAQD